MAELLLELLSEEIPARMQKRAAEDLHRLVAGELAKQGLTFVAARAFATPRRLALVVEGMLDATPDLVEERRGPRVGAPAAALEGFFKSAGVTEAQCEKRATDRGEFWFARLSQPGRPAAPVAKQVIEAALAAFPWPKSMRWASGAERWVRPLHGILCLLDGQVVPVSYAGVSASAATRGHRFLAPEPFAVKGFAEYRDRLRAARVILDEEERRHEIVEAADALAEGFGLSVWYERGLIEEVTGLVEWPVVLTGSIDQRFMELPQEVLVTAMRAHQKYFSLLTAGGKLAPHFVVVANMETADQGAAIVAGNERVLRARLADARFFWEQDRKLNLEFRLPRLAERVFYAGLGTMADKTERLRKLVATLAPICGADVETAQRAALLCKADLATEMVGEFPELQGVMGRYYALADGEKAEVARAVAEHYKPMGPADLCPTAAASVTLALADRVDTLAGFFAIGERPTGAGDPFALRRAALGLIRLVLENGVRLRLRDAFEAALVGYEGIHKLALRAESVAMVSAALVAFCLERLRIHLREQGGRHDLVAAVFETEAQDGALVRLIARKDALEALLASEAGADLLVAYRRAANILRIEEKRDSARYDQAPDAKLFDVPAERQLDAALAKAAASAHRALVAEDFRAAMDALAGLRGPVDAFFESVTVNAEDAELRANRLRLLRRITGAMERVADFSKIEG